MPKCIVSKIILFANAPLLHKLGKVFSSKMVFFSWFERMDIL
jgi:hypothetical protein